MLLACGWAAPSAMAAPGDHIGSEDAQIIPALEVGAQHRTNVYRQEGETGGGVPTSDGTNLYLNPTIGLRAKNDDLKFNLDFSYTARKYLQADVTNLDRWNIIDLGAGLQILPDRPLGLRVSDRFSITGYEAEDDGASVVDSSYQQHLKNDLAAFFMVRPGGPLELDAGGRVTIDQWNVPEETKAAATPDTDDTELLTSQPGPALNDRLGYGPALEAKWRFFPKTAVVADFNYEWFKWRDNILDSRGDGVSREEVGDYLAIPDGRLWRARAGLRGRITSKLVLGALVGFGQSLYDEESVTEAAAELGLDGDAEFADTVGYTSDLRAFPNGFLAELNAEYQVIANHKLTFGYKRDFQDVYFTNYVGYDRLQASYGARFMDKLGVTASGAYRYERYIGEVSRDDHLIRADLEGTWYFEEYLSASLSAGWNRRASADGLHPEIEFDDAAFKASVKFVY